MEQEELGLQEPPPAGVGAPGGGDGDDTSSAQRSFFQEVKFKVDGKLTHQVSSVYSW